MKGRVKAAGRLRYGALVGAFWPAMCASYLLVVILQQKGLSNTAIGTIIAVNSLIGVLIQPLWGLFADSIGSVKKTFLLCAAATSVLFTLLAVVENNVAVVAVIFVDAVFRCSMVSLVDNWLISAVKQNEELDYGRMRIVGSVTYSLISWVYGALMGRYTMQLIILISAVLSLVNIAIAAAVPDTQRTTPGAKGSRGVQVGALVRSRPFLAAALFLILAGFASACTNTYMPNVFAGVGAEANYVSYAQALKAIFEIPLFLFSGTLLKKVPVRTLMLAAALITLCAYMGFLLSPYAILIVFFHIFIGAGYSLMTAAKLNYIYQAVPPAVSATAFTLAGACEYGLGTILGSYLGGRLLDVFSVKVVLACSVLVYIMGVAVFWLLSRDFKGKEKAPA